MRAFCARSEVMPFPIRRKRSQSALLVALILLFTLASTTRSPHELWKLKLTGQAGIGSFNRTGTGQWLSQEGVVFVSPDRVVIYQVNRNPNGTRLAKRDASGGSGNFILLATVLNAHTGQEIRHMQFLTASDYSSILPTHHGNFIVRTGNLLSLFSPNFNPLLARELPLTKEAPIDYWEVRVTPSGKQVVLVHQQVFEGPASSTSGKDAAKNNSKADIEILDGDTLKTLRELHLPYYLPTWSAQEGFLLTTPPKTPVSDGEFGTVDFEGHWSALRPSWEHAEFGCGYKMDPLDHDLMVARGCAGLLVFSRSGHKLLELPPHSWERFVSVAGADQYLAVQTDEFVEPVDKPPSWQPSGIQVYDLKSRERIAFAKVRKDAVCYAISPEGLLAVLEGDVLKLYEAN
jgi:hypothetical protein